MLLKSGFLAAAFSIVATSAFSDPIISPAFVQETGPGIVTSGSAGSFGTTVFQCQGQNTQACTVTEKASYTTNDMTLSVSGMLPAK